jgi:hypothetical protein
MSKPADKPQWVRIAEQFEQSGLTQKQFAQQHELRLSTLQSWIYRRRRQAAELPAPPMRLLPVEVSTARAPQVASVEVLAVSGVRVCFPVGTDVSYVAQLVGALGGASC